MIHFTMWCMGHMICWWQYWWQLLESYYSTDVWHTTTYVYVDNNTDDSYLRVTTVQMCDTQQPMCNHGHNMRIMGILMYREKPLKETTKRSILRQNSGHLTYVIYYSKKLKRNFGGLNWLSCNTGGLEHIHSITTCIGLYITSAEHL